MKYLVLAGDGVESYINEYCEIPQKILDQMLLKENKSNGCLFILSKRLTLIGDRVKKELDEQKNILIQALFINTNKEKEKDEFIPNLTEVSKPYNSEIEDELKKKFLCVFKDELMIFTL